MDLYANKYSLFMQFNGDKCPNNRDKRHLTINFHCNWGSPVEGIIQNLKVVSNF